MCRSYGLAAGCTRDDSTQTSEREQNRGPEPPMNGSICHAHLLGRESQSFCPWVR